MRRILGFIRRLMRPADDMPPPLAELSVPSPETRRGLLEEVHSDLRHRERVLRELEIKAHVRGSLGD